ncbi:hypothetical protein IU450_27975 [Nocardia abscessus]|uniref:hypothetical protein n=1 Tax=Nocardia abscessus TaxID=120957 RepID=UPI001894B5F7|nr:hypothetical protein [Nocardia abscessus]MBF6339702.1 hypothetical protein [Nocardia abscessus]
MRHNSRVRRALFQIIGVGDYMTYYLIPPKVKETSLVRRVIAGMLGVNLSAAHFVQMSPAVWAAENFKNVSGQVRMTGRMEILSLVGMLTEVCNHLQSFDTIMLGSSDVEAIEVASLNAKIHRLREVMGGLFHPGDRAFYRLFAGLQKLRAFEYESGTIQVSMGMGYWIITIQELIRVSNVLDSAASEFGASDLSALDLRGVILDGVRWNSETKWPGDWLPIVLSNSEEVGPQTYEIRGRRHRAWQEGRTTV